jgi:hypothetical protein
MFRKHITVTSWLYRSLFTSLASMGLLAFVVSANCPYDDVQQVSLDRRTVRSLHQTTAKACLPERVTRIFFSTELITQRNLSRSHTTVRLLFASTSRLLEDPPADPRLARPPPHAVTTLTREPDPVLHAAVLGRTDMLITNSKSVSCQEFLALVPARKTFSDKIEEQCRTKRCPTHFVI